MSRDEIIQELAEVRKDLRAYSEARDILHRRSMDQEGTPRHEFFTEWAGFQATMNVFIMCIIRCQGLVEDYTKMLEDMKMPDNVVKLEDHHE